MGFWREGQERRGLGEGKGVGEETGMRRRHRRVCTRRRSCGRGPVRATGEEVQQSTIREEKGGWVLDIKRRSRGRQEKDFLFFLEGERI